MADVVWKYAKPEGVRVKVGDDEVLLQYTLGMSELVDEKYGGLVGVNGELRSFRLDVFRTILNTSSGSKFTREEIFRAGLDSLFHPLAEYLAWLSNGGRPPAPIGEPAKPGNE